MNKHAFLIIAHSEPEILRTLLNMLDDGRNDIFLHIDKKSDELYNSIQDVHLKYADLHILKERIDVHWGGFSQVDVELLLIDTALKSGHFKYYHVLSGVDLPIKTQDYIHDFFERNSGLEFVDFWLDSEHERDLKRKVRYYYIFNRYYRSKRNPLRSIAVLARNVYLPFKSSSK